MKSYDELWMWASRLQSGGSAFVFGQRYAMETIRAFIREGKRRLSAMNQDVKDE